MSAVSQAAPVGTAEGRQQDSSSLPQAQRPPVQVPYVVLDATHPAPSATQAPPKQQPELLQVLPGQQGSVGPPQLLQIPAAVELVAEQMPPALQRLGLADVAAQQGSPRPPQLVQ